MSNKMDSPAKQAKLDSDTPPDTPSPLHSLTRHITPPPRSPRTLQEPLNSAYPKPIKQIPSPIQLTHIQSQSQPETKAPSSSSNNADTVRLGDILGDPLIRECWQFNYMFDVDFLMGQFDPDVRGLVKVKVVHGSWKREDGNRFAIEEGCSRYPNVEPITAYMPEPFGTHHSKMMVLLRHDDLAQIIIHTANMISFDWANMCQGIWRSPLLPLQGAGSPGHGSGSGSIGSGARFKRDILAYLNAYGTKRTGSLVEQLARFDFSDVRAALVASVPSKQKKGQVDSDKGTVWGSPGLKDVLGRVPVRSGGEGEKPHVVVQVSSIATLGQTPRWLHDVFFGALAASASSSPPGPGSNPARPKYSIIFPTPDEIRRSINGYVSGSSIHMKLQSLAQQRQLQYIRPYLCQWAGDAQNRTSSNTAGEVAATKHDAGRRRMAPHIKTYVRFSDVDKMDSVDWAMVTSANLSTQAWGAGANANGEVRICSWEIGVVVWPGLYAEDAKMVPCFKRDLPVPRVGDDGVLVGFRMPYDLPLTPYSKDDMPWSATAVHEEADWLGRTWGS